ncbi:GDSL-type esterase/lipase family protein [Anaerosporobacter faecicola]|uniref:GDSL-type esterase/lipase family protein n=1 Tax=Anaerosporobacter faecicola TaxID=2718714 RepID=UPI001438E0F2|nr:GDSL-type esterase/lipase family protein [Anaerosporobacter faecicola]
MRQLLCFGDSNTWGYDPKTGQRFAWGIRWTSILQEKLRTDYVHVIEEGLCGRTTVFEDIHRAGRCGIDVLPHLLEIYDPIDSIVVMLGTNDCKAAYHTDENRIGAGLEKLVQIIQKKQPHAKILLLSPIYLGEEVWKENYDPEFDKNAVEVSHRLKEVYQIIAKKYGVHFLAASDYATFSKDDQEHMDEKNHEKLANAIYNKIRSMEQVASRVTEQFANVS